MLFFYGKNGVFSGNKKNFKVILTLPKTLKNVKFSPLFALF
jgi:hypothetical protein